MSPKSGFDTACHKQASLVPSQPASALFTQCLLLYHAEIKPTANHQHTLKLNDDKDRLHTIQALVSASLANPMLSCTATR